jgi:hypothetical protein
VEPAAAEVERLAFRLHRPRAPAETRASFDERVSAARIVQAPGGRYSGGASTNDDNVGLHSLNSEDRPQGI